MAGLCEGGNEPSGSLKALKMIWNQVKGYVRQRNTTFKIRDVEVLTEEPIKHVTADGWKKCIEHVMKEEALFWELDNFE
ncbi:hypothetical protein ANN_18866 [Periplaneta americana]|uniref:Uncharacterized protein n=1 Tax=Periplaneta americana TaxID=6978 RepID=A0ABQ8SR68_PERAM|nr:hypothetical protein ANN_18866 [Periplaneta americana]